MTPALKQLMGEHAPLVRAQIVKFFAELKKKVSLQTPHFSESVAILEEFCLRGGKGIRGLLVVLGYLLAGGKDSQIYQVAAGVELFHKHILSLDDIADRDESRNGGPTLWKVYERHFAQSADRDHHTRTMAEIDTTLLGSFAFEVIRTAQLSPAQVLEIWGIFNQVMYWQTIAGWQIHYYQNQEALAAAQESDYILGQEKVTAFYTFIGPLQIGMLAAGLSLDSDLAHTLEKYGKAVGTAFQMRDDILGLFGDSDETGKPVGNDVREGKKTLLLQYAYQTANQDDQKFLTDVCGGDIDAQKLQRVQEIVKQTGALAKAEKLAEDAVQKGVAALDKVDDQPELVQVLRDLAQYVLEREK
jgi:geranylgeranyl diphosphate synthase type I